jgi:uncharacterized protein (TIGR00725 family)
MSAIFSLDRSRGALYDASGRALDAPTRAWRDGAVASGERVDAIAAARWLQRESGAPIRVPVGVIGPRDARPSQLDAAESIGAGLARIGFTIVCGGRHGVMEAACRGAALHDGVTVGLLPDADPALANPHVRVVIATGIGEARNALIARAALCLVAIGDSYGTLSEVALGRQFGKLVVGLEGAARVDGVVHVATAADALERIALFALNAMADQPSTNRDGA